ncbi:MAG: (d)CMP kinase [Firmicutes bacterium]|nr:(d)CMP kinase [Bacillota bacterium]
MQKKPNVAIDGPAGAGKSTVAREIGKRLGLKYLDTGAMYRAITLKLIRNNIDLDDINALRSTLNRTVIRLGDQQEVYLDDEDVTEEIRKPFVNEMVSPVAAQSVVRRHLVALQQQIASETNGIIMEGRDTTSVVLPDADYKFYLDASLEERTRRRNREQQEKGISLSAEEVAIQILKRDNIDSQRADSPLTIVPDATIIDTTNMDFEGVVNEIIQIINTGKQP